MGLRWALVALHLHVALALSITPAKYLVASNPRDGRISYVRVPPGGLPGTGGMNTLVSTKLQSPMGLAIDQQRKLLYVCDPAQHSVFAYRLYPNGNNLSAGSQRLALENVDARWIAVDNFGTVFVTSEPTNQILKAPLGLLRNKTAEVVFNGSSLPELNQPGGVMVDGYYTYWVNKAMGEKDGSVVKAAETPGGTNLGRTLEILASNTQKSYGICGALSNIFYTQPERIIYGVRKTGSAVEVINDHLNQPRGCAWDGEGSIFVADRGANAIFSFPSNMQSLISTAVFKVVNAEDAYGVAVFSGAGPRPALLGLLALALAFGFA